MKIGYRVLLALVPLCLALSACGVNAPTIVTQRVPNAVLGEYYLQWVRVIGGGGEPYTWTMPGGTLPPGVHAEQFGRHVRIGGVPTQLGSYSFTLEVFDAGDRSAKRTFTIGVYAPLKFETDTLPDAILDQPYSGEITVSGGTGGGYFFGVTAGDWPLGLGITVDDDKCIISGTPIVYGTFEFELFVSDPSQLIVKQTFTLVINAVAPLVITTAANLADTAIGIPYTAEIAASGGSEKGYGWTLLTGALPDGLTFAGATPSLTISGTPTAAGSFTFVFQVEDSEGRTATKAFVIVVELPVSITTTSLPDGEQLSLYFAVITATGGVPGYTWSIVVGALPAGVTLAQGTPSAQLSGTPQEYGTFSVTVRASSAAGDFDEATFSFDVDIAFLIAAVSFPDGEEDVSYSRPVSAAGGTGAGYQWSIVSGALPTGLVLDATGTPSSAVHGVPTASGSFSFTIQVVDSGSNVDTVNCNLMLYPAVNITTTSLPDGDESANYSTFITATGGKEPIDWDLITGSPPPGITFQFSTTRTIELRGSTGSTGTFNFTLRVNSAAGGIDDQVLSLRIIDQIGIDTTSLGNGVATQAYAATLSGHGGTETGYLWTLSAGALPPGLSFLTSGTPSTNVTGTPSRTGAYSFTVKLEDSQGHTASRTFSIVVDSYVTTVVGNGESLAEGQLLQPGYIAIGADGAIFTTGRANKIYRRDPGTGVLAHYAGTGLQPFNGDGNIATLTNFWGIGGMAEGPDGALYVSDPGNYRVRRIDPMTKLVTTVVGTGAFGFSGDGGPATAAKIGGPRSLAFDTLGNLYLVDSENNRIRKRAASNGFISTIAGNGTQIIVDDVIATSSGFESLEDIACDGSAYLYLTETYAERVRRIDLGSSFISHFAGNGQTGFTPDGMSVSASSLTRPVGIAVRADSSVVICEREIHRVRSINPVSRVITTVAGIATAYNQGGFFGDGGPASVAELNSPYDVVAASSGAICFSDSSNHRLRQVSAGIIDTVAGDDYSVGDGGAPQAAVLNQPSAMAFDSQGRLLISTAGRIRRVNFQLNVIEHFAGQTDPGFSGDGQAATNAQFQYVGGLACAGNGDVYVADTYNHRIRKITAATGVIDTIAGTGVAGYATASGPALSAQFNGPRCLRMDALGRLLVADTNNNLIRRIDLSTGMISTVAGVPNLLWPPGSSGDGGPATSAHLSSPHSMDVDSAGNIYIADSFNHKIRKVTVATGIITTVAGDVGPGFTSDFPFVATQTRLSSPRDVVVGANGTIYIMDEGNRRVRYVDPTTGLIRTLVGGGSSLGDNGPGPQAQLEMSLNLVIGPDGCIYIADTYHNRVRKVERVQ